MSDPGRSLKVDIGLVVLGGIIVTFGGIGQSWMASTNEQHNVAQAIYFDVSVTSDHLNSSFDVNKTIDLLFQKDPTLPIVHDPRPYYNNNGAYFVFMKDISSFDENTSDDIYQYYQMVQDIEYKRQYIVNKLPYGADTQNLSQSDLNYLSATSLSMALEINDCKNLGNKIKKELKDKYNLNSNLPTYYSPNIYSPPMRYLNY